MFDWLKVKLAGLLPAPTIQTFKRAVKFFAEVKGNKYDLYWAMYHSDADLYGSIRGFASIVSQMYNGVFVHTDGELNTEEKRLLQEARALEDEYDLYDVFYCIAEQLGIMGDCVVLKTDLQFLPMQYLTILENRDQIQQAAQIFEPNIYVLNEDNDEKRKVFNKDEVMHFSLSRRAHEVTDIKNRYTYGIYSISPLEPLVPDIYWKRSIKIDDILLRHKIVPREHHKLDLTGIKPERFAGTVEEKYKAMEDLAKQKLKEYRDTIKEKEVDEGWVTSHGVEIGYVEPKHVSYLEPNRVIDQINLSIANATRYPPSLSGGPRGSYASEYIIAGTLAVDARHVARQIAKKLENWLREKCSGSPELKRKLHIKLQYVLNYERAELARIIAILAATGSFYRNEIRELWGADPIAEDELVQIKQPAQSVMDIARDVSRRTGIPEHRTPRSRESTQAT